MEVIRRLGVFALALVSLAGCASQTAAVAGPNAAAPLDMTAFTPPEEQEMDFHAKVRATRSEKDTLLQPQLITQQDKKARRLNVLP